MDNLKWNCKCGGVFELKPLVCGVEHTYPTCQAYNDLDLDELIKTPGALAAALIKMRKDVASA